MLNLWLQRPEVLVIGPRSRVVWRCRRLSLQDLPPEQRLQLVGTSIRFAAALRGDAPQAGLTGADADRATEEEAIIAAERAKAALQMLARNPAPAVDQAAMCQSVAIAAVRGVSSARVEEGSAGVVDPSDPRLAGLAWHDVRLTPSLDLEVAPDGSGGFCRPDGTPVSAEHGVVFAGRFDGDWSEVAKAAQWTGEASPVDVAFPVGSGPTAGHSSEKVRVSPVGAVVPPC